MKENERNTIRIEGGGKMKKILIALILSLTTIGLVACGENANSHSEIKKKDLKLKDVEKIKVGISKDKLLEKLGKPLKIWDDDYVSEELEDSISRTEMFSEYIDGSEKKIKQGKKAQKMKSLKMYQYTYTNEEKEKETFLAWIGTDSVKYIDMRAYMDKDGYSESSEDEDTDSYTSDEAEDTESTTFSIGDTATYENGQEFTINSITVANNEKDEYDEVTSDLVKVEFTVDNQTDDVLDFNSHLIELYDGDRNKAELLSKDFYSEEIAKGMKSNGVAYFDAGKGPYKVIVGAGEWENN